MFNFLVHAHLLLLATLALAGPHDGYSLDRRLNPLSFRHANDPGMKVSPRALYPALSPSPCQPPYPVLCGVDENGSKIPLKESYSYVRLGMLPHQR